MNIIITMAGLGTRFRDAGWNCPKFMIDVHGKSLFDWSLDSLEGYMPVVSKFIFVVRKLDFAHDFIHSKCSMHNIHEPVILELDHVTDGQASTCMTAIPFCKPDDSMLVYNIDTYVEPFALKYQDISGDGHIPCFNASGEHWSFVKLDESGFAVEVAEKLRISDNCSLGAYYFSSAHLFADTYHEFYSGNSTVKEKFIAPMYNLLIRKGMKVTISLIDSSKVHVLGTPQELNAFAQQMI